MSRPLPDDELKRLIALSGEMSKEIGIFLDKTGNTDASHIINHHLQSIGKEFRLGDGVYAVENTIEIPHGKRLLLSHGATLRPKKNKNVIKLNSECQLQGGKIDCSSVPNFSKAVFYTTGANTYGFKVIDCFALHPSYQGTGIHIAAQEGEYVFGNFFSKYNFERF